MIQTDQISEVFLMDNMEGMAQFPDNYFDLAVVDPPYGIGATSTIGSGDLRSGRKGKKKWGDKQWDKERPTKEYFNELQRISKDQIIFGGNYFSDLLSDSRCWIVWDKMQRIDQADAELAWTSFKGSVRIYQYHASRLMGFLNPNRFHPTEKPVPLYDWIYKKYLPEGGKVIDTHLGSGSNRIAADKAGNIDFTAYEIDPDYFRDQEKRFKDYKSQLRMF